MMHPHAAMKHLLHLRSDALAPLELADLRMQGRLLVRLQERQALELLRQAPALLAIEAEDERGHLARVAVPLGHGDELLGEKLIGDPLVRQRNAPLGTLHELELSLMAAPEP